MTEDEPTRRRLVAALAALFVALLGAGFGTSRTFETTSSPDDDFDLFVDFRTERAKPAWPTGTPGPTPTSEPSPSPNRSTVGPRSPSADESSGDSDPSPTGDFPDGDDDPVSSVTASPTPTADSSLLTAAAQPLTLSNLHPGDAGTVTARLSLSGAPARLWYRGDVTAVDERRLTEPELMAGDDDATGELQSYVDVRLWYADGDTDVTVYDGPLTGLQSTWTRLADRCFAPDAHALYLDWTVDADAPNVIQSDAVTFSFGVAASSCA